MADCDLGTFDSVRQPVTWSGEGDLAQLNGRTVRLRFTLKDARLYSFRVT